MDRTERFYKIEMLIRHRECVSFAALLEALEVSPATLKRDLQYLRERMDAPIEYDAMANGYRFGQQWRGTKHELPGVWFSEKELHALLTMHQLMSSLDEEGLLTRATELQGYFAEAVHSLKGEPNVIDVRNIGLVGGIELSPLPGEPAKRAFNVFLDCYEQGVLVRTTGDTVALSPPLIIERSHIDRLIETVRAALRRAVQL